MYFSREILQTILLTSLHKIKCASADADAVEDCWDVCGPYLGRINQTSSGITCQSWRDQEPHGHYYQTDGWFPREGLDGAQNSCRDPETGWWKPWCFTVDPNIRWDICTIPLCNSTKTSQEIKCGTYACQIDRTHCDNNMTSNMTFDLWTTETLPLTPDISEMTGKADADEDCWDVCGSYMGRINRTSSGRRCQAWRDQSPHQHLFQTDDWFPGEGLDGVENYCRGGTGWQKPWCFSVDPNIRWEVCTVPLCNSTKTSKQIKCGTNGCQIDRTHCNNNMSYTSFVPWITDTLPLTTGVVEVTGGADADEDCWDVCGSYMGRINRTGSGRRCQAWRDQSPHQHYYQTDDWFPGEGLDGVENYCRDPETGWWKPWCFSVDPNIRWEICTVPLCNSTKTSKQIKCGTHACQINRTHCNNNMSNITFDLWTTDTLPLTTGVVEVTGGAHDDGDDDCWDVCEPYMGRINQTSSGRRCQSWRAQKPHAHYFETDDRFPGEGLDGAENYCRDPETGWWRPWCFTVDPSRRWEICTVPLCGSKKTSKQLKCGTYVCDIDRSHCSNETRDDTLQEVEAAPIGVSLAIILGVLMFISVIAAGLFVVLVKADRREKQAGLRAGIEENDFGDSENQNVTTISGKDVQDGTQPPGHAVSDGAEHPGHAVSNGAQSHAYRDFAGNDMGESYEM